MMSSKSVSDLSDARPFSFDKSQILDLLSQLVVEAVELP